MVGYPALMPEQVGFRVDKVTLWNFRGFSQRVALALHPTTTVLAGENGSGKSSVLDALASLVAGIPAILTGAAVSSFEGGDTKNVGRAEKRAIWQVEGMLLGSTFGLSLTAALPTAPELHRRPIANLERFVELGRPGSAETLPLLSHVHSSSTRPPATRPVASGLDGRLAAYIGAFDSESLQFEQLESWFEREENLENQEKIQQRNFHHELRSLRSVRRALHAFLTTLQGTRLGRVSVVRSHRDGPLAPARGELVVEKDGAPLFLSQLSDGERRLVLMICDTARRMAILNPHLEEPHLGPGLLLIDELELHLHPRWQRTSLAAVRAAFPNLQVVVATHSPAIIGSVPRECVAILKDGTVLAPDTETKGRDPNTILTDVMEARLHADTLDEQFDALFRAIDSERPAEAKRLLARLRKELGPDHPELVRARALLDLLAA